MLRFKAPGHVSKLKKKKLHNASEWYRENARSVNYRLLCTARIKYIKKKN